MNKNKTIVDQPYAIDDEAKSDDPIRQGDIIGNIQFIEYFVEDKGKLELSVLEFPFVIVLSQDCDLQQDKNNVMTEWVEDQKNNGMMLSVIVAPLYNSGQLLNGEHLAKIGNVKLREFKGNTEIDFVQKNEIPRYHYIEFPDGVPIPDSIIDFKHYFTVNMKLLKKAKESRFIAKVAPLYREKITHRFSCYLSRIGLPSSSTGK